MTEDDGSTDLGPDDAEGLKLGQVQTRAELNAVEQANITEGLRWLGLQRNPEVLSESFLRELHRRMFGEVWRWAGQFRRRETNLGVAPSQVPTRVRNLLYDVRAQVKEPREPPRELALRFHHRLVQIHCFPNGNGRHGRVMTDALCQHVLNVPPVRWGGRVDPADISGTHRAAYLSAVRAADSGDYRPLLELFAG